MTPHLKAHIPPENRSQRRSVWRQRLVEAERGMTDGFRGDSTFFVHFFAGSVVLAAGFVLGISLDQWAIVILALTFVLSAEMFNQVVKGILRNVGHHFDESLQRSLRVATAAVFLTMTGTIVTIGLIFGQRIVEMLAGI